MNYSPTNPSLFLCATLSFSHSHKHVMKQSSVHSGLNASNSPIDDQQSGSHMDLIVERTCFNIPLDYDISETSTILRLHDTETSISSDLQSKNTLCIVSLDVVTTQPSYARNLPLSETVPHLIPTRSIPDTRHHQARMNVLAFACEHKQHSIEK